MIPKSWHCGIVAIVSLVLLAVILLYCSFPLFAVHGVPCGKLGWSHCLRPYEKSLLGLQINVSSHRDLFRTCKGPHQSTCSHRPCKYTWSVIPWGSLYNIVYM